MAIPVADSNATISAAPWNSQPMFSAVGSLCNSAEFADDVPIANYQFNFGTGGGGGGGREGRPSSGVGFALGGTIGPVAVIILTKDVPGPQGVQIHEFGTNKLGEALAELMLRLWEMIESQIGKREKLSSEKKEKLMNI